MTPLQRRALVVLLLVLAPVAALVVWLATHDALPDPIATHWQLDGDPDGFTSPGGFAAGMIAVSAAMAVLGSVVVTIGSFRAGSGPIAGVLAWTAWVFAGGVGDALISAHGVADAHDARSGWSHSVVVIVVGLVVALAVWRLTPIPPSSIDAAAVAEPSYRLSPGERAVWVGSASSRPLLRTGMVLVGVGTLGLAVVALVTMLGVVSPGTSTDGSVLISALVVIVVGLAAAWCHSITVRVDATGVTARLGGVPWPRFRVPLERIEAARAELVEPMQWGGWGYRVGGRRGSALVVRKGQGIVLARHGRPDFAITVDDAERAAELVNALVSARLSARAT